jgi:hypothetical protein
LRQLKNQLLPTIPCINLSNSKPSFFKLIKKPHRHSRKKLCVYVAKKNLNCQPEALASWRLRSQNIFFYSRKACPPRRIGFRFAPLIDRSYSWKLVVLPTYNQSEF